MSVRKFFYWQKKTRDGLYNETKREETGLVAESTALAPAFAEIKATPIAEPRSGQFQPDAVIKVGDISIQMVRQKILCKRKSTKSRMAR